jgi:hypothetical protein
MYLHLSTNGIIAVVTGVGVIAWGIWGLTQYLFDYFSFGLVLFGSGFIIFGITDGFNDQSYYGRILFKVGILCFLASALILGYFFIRLI